MTDILKQIDEGIGRHHRMHDINRCGGGCGSWPCETLKALRGWREAQAKADRYNVQAKQQHDLAKAAKAKLREAVVEGERLKEENVRLVDCGATSPEPCRFSPPCLVCHAVIRDRELEAAEAKLKDAEAQIERLKGYEKCGRCGDVRAYHHGLEYAHPFSSAEAQNRALVEALEKAYELSRGFEKPMTAKLDEVCDFLREALAQAKERG